MNLINLFKKNFLKSKTNTIFSLLALVITISLTAITGIEFKNFSDYEPFFWGNPKTSEDATGNPNVTRVEHFSDYSPNLKGTKGDAAIYVLEGEEEGPSLLILGGTHPNEPSGQLTATLLLENLKVNKGTVYIVTETNRSAFTHSYPQEGSPFYYTIKTASGADRVFKFGSRATNTNEQWPNPDIYVHQYSGQKLSTSETRNINRAYPGLKDGTFTEMAAYAVTRLIQENDITVTVDLHEASPEYQTINAFIAHEVVTGVNEDGSYKTDGGRGAKAIADAARSVLNPVFEEDGSYINSEKSPDNLHGLTHRELGDHTDTLPMIIESSNASQGKYKGAFTEGLILYRNEDGSKYEDPYYEFTANLDDGKSDTHDGSLYARPCTIEERVARHASSIAELIYQYNKLYFGVENAGDTPEAKSTFIKKDFRVDLAEVSKGFGATKYTTDKQLQDARKASGIFDIDFSNIYNNTNLTGTKYNDAELKKVSENVYKTIYNYSIGTFLHDPIDK